MSYPSGMKWKNGYATDGFYHYVLCQKAGHKRFFKCTKIKEDALQALNEHRALHHSTLGEKVMRAAERLFSDDDDPVTIGVALRRYEELLNERERRREISAKTVEFHSANMNQLRRHIAAHVLLKDVKITQMYDYIDSRKKAAPRRTRVAKAGERVRIGGKWTRLTVPTEIPSGGTATQGAAIEKEIGTLRAAARACGVVYAWTLADLKAKIGAKKRARTPTSLAEAMRWIAAMDEPVKSFAHVKLLTGGNRNEELFEQTVSRFRPDLGGWFVNLHVKAGGEQVMHWQELNEDAIAILTKLCEGKAPEDLIWTRPGTSLPLTTEYMRYPLEKASRLAGLTPERDRIGSFRHLGLTYLTWKLGPFDAQKYIGHRRVTTTQRYDRPELFAELGLIQKDRSKLAAKTLGEAFKWQS